MYSSTTNKPSSSSLPPHTNPFCKACSRGYRKNKIIEEEIRPKIAEDTGNIAGRKISGIQERYRQGEIAVEEKRTRMRMWFISSGKYNGL
jgi:hypothetical protein